MDVKYVSKIIFKFPGTIEEWVANRYDKFWYLQYLANRCKRKLYKFQTKEFHFFICQSIVFDVIILLKKYGFSKNSIKIYY